MFPPGSEGFDMGQMLQQAQRMQEQLMSAQQELAEAEVTGTAGGGLVQATVAGTGELTNLHIDPSVVDPDDVDTLADLIIAAVRDAHAEIQRRSSEQLGAINADVASLLGGSGLPPGLAPPGAPPHADSPGDMPPGSPGSASSGSGSPGQGA